VAAILRIVDAISTSATVILDLNAGAASGTNIGSGDVALADTELNDAIDTGRFWQPTVIGRELSTRHVDVPITIIGASVDDLATRVATLMAATRAPFYLEVRRHGAAASSWLRCFPCVPQVSTRVTSTGTANIAVGQLTTTSDPYAYGAMVDTGALTFTQDPSVGGFWVADINNVAGDSLTPCVFRSQTSAVATTSHATLLSIRRRGTPSSLSGLVRQGESANSTTAVTGGSAATVSADATLSNSSAMRVTFVNAVGSGAELNYTSWGLSGNEAPGLYRMLVRARRNGTSAGQEHAFRPIIGATVLPDVLWAAGGSDFRVLDLGLVQVPTAQAPRLSAPLTARPATAADVRIVVLRPAALATGTLDVDWLALVPTDEDTGLITQTGGGAASSWEIVDGYSNNVYIANADPIASTSASMLGISALPATGSVATTVTSGLAYIGGVPRLRPGNNRLYVVAGMSPVLAWGMVSQVWSVAYWPRYSWLV
jgi:hypothetical protein